MLTTNQYETETTLINFRVPKTLKKTFDSVCKYKTENRTKTLIDLMKTYIDDEVPVIESQINRQNNMLRNFQR